MIYILAVLLISVTALLFTARRAQRRSGVEWGGKTANLIAGLNILFCRRYHRLVGGVELPPKGGAIVVANHISGLDPLLLIAAAPRPLRFLIAREEYERKGLRWLFRLARCIPVDRSGRADLAMREALRALQRGDVVALFPHGKIHLDSDPPRRIKAGAVRLARRAAIPLYPVRIGGITGAGLTLGALLPRSRAQLDVFAPLHCETDLDHHYTPVLARILEGRLKPGHEPLLSDLT